MFTELAPGIFSVESRFVDGKNGIVIGERAALAIDGSNYPDEGQTMADFIRSHGHEPERLLLTHGHNDHILGAGPLAGGEVFAHALTPGVIDAQIPDFARRWDVSVAEAARRVIRPTVTFRDELWIDLGGTRVWAFPTPGHSADGVSIYVERGNAVSDDDADGRNSGNVRLLFAGDAVVTGIVPAIANGHSAVLEQSLHRLLALDIDILVPGHGRVLYGADVVQDWLRWQAGYLAGVRAAVRTELARGATPEDAANAVDFETFIGERLPADRHNMPKRHRDTVRKIVAETQA